MNTFLELRQDVIGRNPAVLNVVRIIQAAIETVRGEERGAHAVGVAAEDVSVQGVAAHQRPRRIVVVKTAHGDVVDGGIGFAADAHIGKERIRQGENIAARLVTDVIRHRRDKVGVAKDDGARAGIQRGNQRLLTGGVPVSGGEEKVAINAFMKMGVALVNDAQAEGIEVLLAVGEANQPLGHVARIIGEHGQHGVAAGNNFFGAEIVA